MSRNTHSCNGYGAEFFPSLRLYCSSCSLAQIVVMFYSQQSLPWIQRCSTLRIEHKYCTLLTSFAIPDYRADDHCAMVSFYIENTIRYPITDCTWDKIINKYNKINPEESFHVLHMKLNCNLLLVFHLCVCTANIIHVCTAYWELFL